MPLNIRIDGTVVILSNFARLMNDPRYVDASRDIRDLLDQGHRNFILDLGGVRQTGSSFLGVLMTLTRQIQQHGGEAVLAHVGRDTEEFLGMMLMDDYWDTFSSVAEATEFFRRSSAGAPTDHPDS
jgi:anti-sigma B factor antagonist